MKYSVLVFLLLFSGVAFAQTPTEIERDLVRLYGDVEKYSSYSGSYSEEREESLYKANDAFKAGLLKATAKNPSVLRHSFPELSEQIVITTSPDGKFRAYSWDQLSGGTMHFYDVVYQYESGGRVYSSSTEGFEGDPLGFVNSIYDVDLPSGRIYLVVTTSVLSTSLRGQSVTAVKVKRGQISEDVAVFKTGSGMRGSIGFAYDFFSVVDREERPVKLFDYDSKSKILSFPVVIEDEATPQGRVTDRRIKYALQNGIFVKSK
ncbi:MAG: hypothetical protein R2684_16820 [Pyrinomonadaceae bacterium]